MRPPAHPGGPRPDRTGLAGDAGGWSGRGQNPPGPGDGAGSSTPGRSLLHRPMLRTRGTLSLSPFRGDYRDGACANAEPGGVPPGAGRQCRRTGADSTQTAPPLPGYPGPPRPALTTGAALPLPEPGSGAG